MHLVILAGRADAVFEVVLHLAGRKPLILGSALSEARERVVEVSGLLDQIRLRRTVYMALEGGHAETRPITRQDDTTANGRRG
jgi:hypothetical protein